MADQCCRASGPICPQCGHGEGSWVLFTGGTRIISLECPQCGYEWLEDTGFGVCDRPAVADHLPDWPEAA